MPVYIYWRFLFGKEIRDSGENPREQLGWDSNPHCSRVLVLTAWPPISSRQQFSGVQM